MKQNFKEFVRYCVEEKRCLQDRKKDVLQHRLPGKDLEQQVAQAFKIAAKSSITTETIKEFMIRYDTLYVDSELSVFFQVLLIKNSESNKSVSLNEFTKQIILIPIDIKSDVATQSEEIESNEAFKVLKFEFNLHLLIKQSIKYSLGLDYLKEYFRMHYNPSQLFEQIRNSTQKVSNNAQYSSRRYILHKEIQKYTRLNPQMIEDFLKLTQGITQNDGKLYRFFFYKVFSEDPPRQYEEVSPKKDQEEDVASLVKVPKQRLQHEMLHLAKYFLKIIEYSRKIQSMKESLINRYESVTPENYFLMFSPSLKASISTQIMIDKWKYYSGFSTKQIKSLSLFARRYCDDKGGCGGYKLKVNSFVRFLSPVHDSYAKILARKRKQKLIPLKQPQIVDLLRLLQTALEMETQLDCLKFRQRSYSDIFLQLDQDRDSLLSETDLRSFFKSLLPSLELKAKDIVLLMRQFTQNSNINYSEFVEQMQDAYI